MTTQVSQIQERIEALKLEQLERDKKIAELEKRLEGEHGPLFKPQGENYFYLFDARKGIEAHESNGSRDGREYGPKFRKESTAKAFADAINTWLEWNMCEGRVGINDSIQWTADLSVVVTYFNGGQYKRGILSPAFDTKENCQASINLIGKDRIKAMRKGWHITA